MSPEIFIIIVLVLLLAYFIVVVISSRIEAERARVYHRKADDNRKVVFEFYDGVFNKHDLGAAERSLDENYVQHNPTVPTGKAAFMKAMAALLDKCPSWKSDIKRTIAEGDLVTVHCQSFKDAGDPSDKGSAVMDIFRIENGRIMEHWDVVQPVPLKAENSNTMF